MRVGVMLGNCAEFPITWLAIARLGAVMVPINPELHPAGTCLCPNQTRGLGPGDRGGVPTDARAMHGSAPGLDDDRLIVLGKTTISRAREWSDLLGGGASRHASAEPILRDDLLNIR